MRVAAYGLCCRGCCGGRYWVGRVVRLGCTARPPPPGILPAAPCASLGLGGASRRASPFGLAGGCCLEGAWRTWLGGRRTDVRGSSVSVCRGAEQRGDVGRSRRVSAKLQDSNHHRLARAPRLGLPGPSPQVHPTRSASRAVRRSPMSRLCSEPRIHPPPVVLVPLSREPAACLARHSLRSALPAPLAPGFALRARAAACCFGGDCAGVSALSLGTGGVVHGK